MIMDDTYSQDQRHIFRGELALLLVIIMNSFGVVLSFIPVPWNFCHFQCTLRIFRSISVPFPGNMDVYFSGNPNCVTDGSS